MGKKTCCVTGHRDIPAREINRVKAALRREIEKAVTDGFARFMSGFAEGVDQYFAETVLELKKSHPALELIAVIPYQKRLDSLREKNRYMVEHSDRVIAVYDGREKGGTAGTIRFAHAMEKELREIPVGAVNVPEYLKK